MLSVKASDPLSAPTTPGAKLIGNWQDAPAANVPAVKEPLVTSGHAEDPLLFKLKFAVMLGLFPVDGTGKFSVALPVFSTVTV